MSRVAHLKTTTRVIRRTPVTDWQKTKMAAFDRALAKFKRGEPHIEDLIEANRAELMALQERGTVKRVSVLTADSCPACMSLSGKVFTLKEALELMPLPVRSCGFALGKRVGWCRCEWTPEIEM